jgi:hypothetical protein
MDAGGHDDIAGRLIIGQSDHSTRRREMIQLHPRTLRFAGLLGTVLFLTGCAAHGNCNATASAQECEAARNAAPRSLSMGAGDSLGQGFFARERTSTADTRD